jgi:hypothetical protein
MNRHTILADIAGRTSKEIAGNPRVTSAAVAISTADMASLRQQLPSNLPQWGRCTSVDAEAVVSLLASRSIAVAIVSINKDTPAWREFIHDEEVLHSEIASESRRPAGWAKAGTILTFELLSRACFMATAHAIGARSATRIVDAQGMELVETSIICDTEVSGSENIDVFKSLWNEEHTPKETLARMGLRVIHREVKLLAEETEPLLFLADYAAGLGHSAHLPNPGRLPMPVSCVAATALLRRLAGKLVVEAFDFDMSYEKVFGDVMQEARRRRSG